MTNIRTDLEIAEDLRSLCQIIDEAIDKVNHILQRMQRIDEVRELIQDIDRASQNLEESERKLEQAQSDIEHLKNLPQALRQLGIHENFLPEVQRILNEIRESRRWFEQLLNELQANQQTIRRNLEEFNQEIIAVRDLENYLRNFQQYRSGRKLRNFLYQELGFAGLVIYILHLLKPRRRDR